MVKKPNLNAHLFPKIMSDLMHSNQFLKIFSICSLALTVLALTAIITMANRSPEVIAVSRDGIILSTSNYPNPENLIEEAVKTYVKHRYEWSPENVSKQLQGARNFIGRQSSAAFADASRRVVSFSLEKKVSQKAFPTEISIDLKKSIARISGDRVTSIQGLKAAGDLKLELHFQPGPHTKENPWGVYISKEVELL